VKKKNYTTPEVCEQNGCYYVHFQFRNWKTGRFENFRINSPKAKHDMAYARELCRRAGRTFRMGYWIDDKDFTKHTVDEQVFLYIGKLNWVEWLLEICNS
jgi:hypothetical protein